MCPSARCGHGAREEPVSHAILLSVGSRWAVGSADRAGGSGHPIGQRSQSRESGSRLYWTKAGGPWFLAQGAPAVESPGSRIASRASLEDGQEQLAKPSQFVTFQNTDPAQTHIVINRYRQGVALQPGEKKQVEMVADEIATFRHLARTDRGFYSAGQNAGKPFPPHPVKILDVGPIRSDDTVLPAAPSEPERPQIEA
jgi:hypothetical protein